MVTDIGVLTFVHVLGLVYWLGADLGVFYSSYYLADDTLTAETRVTVAKILFWLDQAPRIAMPIMLGTGWHLAWRFGVLPFPGVAVVAVWLLVAAWLAFVFLLHGKPNPLLARMDFGLRLFVVAGTAATAAWGLAAGTIAYWVSAKLIVFAVLVASGLIIRLRLKPFGPAFAALAAGNPGDTENQTIRAVFAATRPFVLVIWAGLIANTLFGLHLI